MSRVNASDYIRKLINLWPIIIGLLVIYVPTYLNLINSVWNNEDQAHGPLVVFIVLYLVWLERNNLLIPKINEKNEPILGLSLVITGLLFYILGRSQDIVTFDIGSQIFVFSGLILIFRGVKTLKAFWFPLFFLLFMIPLPAFFVDAITLPMKIAVSYVAEFILYNFGYPVARSGVIIEIGQYQLLVADACAGLHTLISLEALGLLYLNVVKHDSLFRNFSLALLIVPISFTANVVRVMILILVTFYFGDAAGRGFIHGFAGMVLFIVALTLIMGMDTLLQIYEKNKQNLM